MNQQDRNIRKFSKTLIAGLIASGALLAPAVHAQLSTATIRGQVAQLGASQSVQITATNVATGASFRASVQRDGSYVLVGLAPGTYSLVVAGAKDRSFLTIPTHYRPVKS